MTLGDRARGAFSQPSESPASRSLGAAPGARDAGSDLSPRAFWLALAAIIAVGLALRAAILFDYLANNPLASHPIVDALTYWSWAGRIAAGRLSDGTPFFSAPLYPYMLGMLRAVGAPLAGVYAFQIALDGCTAALLALLGRRLFAPRVGLLAAGVFLLMLEPASFSLRVLTASLQLPLVCWTWLALEGAWRRTTVGRTLAAGAANGLLALSYPPAMLFLPILAAWWWLLGGRSWSVARHALAYALSGAAVIAPATIHNWVVTIPPGGAWQDGELFPIQSVLGVNFRQGNGPGAEGIITMIPGTSQDREELFRAAQVDFRRRHGRDGTWRELDNYYRDQAIDWWKQDWGRAARLFARKAYWYLAGRNFGDIYQPTLEIAEGLTPALRLAPLHTAWLLPAALLALGAWSRGPGRTASGLLIFASSLAIVIVFWFSPRYRNPALPIIALGAAWALWKVGLWRQRPGWAAAVGLALLSGLGLDVLNRATGFDSLERFRAQFYDTVGLALAEAGRLEEARGWYERALELDPRSAKAQAGLAETLARLGESDEAIRRLRAVVAASPHDATAHDQLARVLFDSGQSAAALAHFEQAARINPNNAQFRNNYGNALRLTGAVERAVEQYEAALRIAPGYAPAHTNLAQTLLIRGEADRALEHALEATRLAPQDAQAHWTLATVRHARRETPQMIAALKGALARAPQDRALRNELIWQLATAPGLPAASRAEAARLAQSLLQDPALTAAELDTAAAALAAAGDFGQARALAGRAVELGQRTGSPDAVAEYQARLELYERGEAFEQAP